MTSVTRQEARRRRAANSAQQAAFYESESSKILKLSKNSKILKDSKILRVSKVSSASRTSKIQRSLKSMTAICNRLLSLSAFTSSSTDATSFKEEILKSSLASSSEQTTSSKVELSNSSLASSSRQTALFYIEIRSSWLNEYDHSDWSHFTVTDWNASSRVVRRTLSSQWSSKSSLSNSQSTLFENLSLSLVNTNSANLKLDTVDFLRFYKKSSKIFKFKNSSRQSQTFSSHSFSQFKFIKKLNIKVISLNSERSSCISSSCSVHSISHKQSTYLHDEASSKNHFTFAWSNSLSEVWAAHQKNRHDETIEQELALIASFRAYHDQRAIVSGIITSGICQNELIKIRECSFSFWEFSWTLLWCRSHIEHSTLFVHDWIEHDVSLSCNHHLELLLRQRYEILYLQDRSCILISVSSRTKNMIVQFLEIFSLLNRESCSNFVISLIFYSHESDSVNVLVIQVSRREDLLRLYCVSHSYALS